MATYNGEKYIREQLDSILCQINDEDEIIVSDDGSIDSTIKIIQSYNDKRIKIFKNNGLRGYAHNFENALNHSSGNYIFFSDQDDVWLPDKVKKMLPYLKEDNLVICNAFFTDKDLKKQQTINQWRPYKKGFFQNLYKNTFWGCTFAFTSKIKNYCTPIPANIIGHDSWIALLCELKFKIVYVKQPLMLYRRHGNNLSNRLPVIKMLAVRLIYLWEIIKWLIKKYNQIK
jgi:glycosyltransferase involved in cell wall biosynthesis